MDEENKLKQTMKMEVSGTRAKGTQLIRCIITRMWSAHCNQEAIVCKMPRYVCMIFGTLIFGRQWRRLAGSSHAASSLSIPDVCVSRDYRNVIDFGC